MNMYKHLIITALLCVTLGMGIGLCIERFSSKAIVKDTVEELKEEVIPLSEWQILQMAMVKTESEFNPLAVGKAKDIGILQITKIWVEDVNRISGNKYLHEDAFDPALSLEMFNIYQNYYNPGKNILKAIHIHNPGGESIQYTSRVLRSMEQIKQYEQIRTIVTRYQ